MSNDPEYWQTQLRERDFGSIYQSVSFYRETVVCIRPTIRYPVTAGFFITEEWEGRQIEAEPGILTLNTADC